MAFGLELVLIVAFGLLTSALHPALRDVKYLVESGLLIGFYATPVLYDPSQLTGTLPKLLPFNPFTGILSLFRGAVLGRSVDWTAVGLTVLISAVVGLVGASAFRRRSDEFADLV